MLKDAGATLPAEASLGDRRNMVFSGTAVATGRGRAVVTGTGMRTEMGTIARLLGTTEDDPTPLQREIAGVGKVLGLGVIVIALVVMGGIVLTSDLRTGQDYVQVLLVGVSLAVAAVPEGLPAILSVVLALGVQRMARRKAIVKRLQSVEALGSASVICTDKTGTLTQNEMTLRRVLTAPGEVEMTGTGYDPEGSVRHDGRRLGEDDEATRPWPRRSGRPARRQPRQRREPAPRRRGLADPGRPDRGRVPGRGAKLGITDGERAARAAHRARCRSPPSAR